MYIVRFFRADGQPDEEYYYQRKEDANIHFDLFKVDDSGLYSKIAIEKHAGTTSSVLKVKDFSSNKCD